MKVTTLSGYDIHVPTSGGKAGKGRNKTTSLQIRRGNAIAKQFTFVLADEASRSKVTAKAKKWIAENPIKQGEGS